MDHDLMATGFQFIAQQQQWAGWIMVSLLALIAAGVDIQSRRIPNKLVLVTFGLGMLWLLLPGGSFGILGALGGCAIAAIPFLLFFALLGGGAGDVKLMGGLGFWLGPHGALVLLCSVLIMGGIEGIVYALMKRRGWAVLQNIKYLAFSLFMRPSGLGEFQQHQRQMNDSGQWLTMPYGVAIFGGSCLGAIGTWLWHW